MLRGPTAVTAVPLHVTEDEPDFAIAEDLTWWMRPRASEGKGNTHLDYLRISSNDEEHEHTSQVLDMPLPVSHADPGQSDLPPA